MRRKLNVTLIVFIAILVMSFCIPALADDDFDYYTFVDFHAGVVIDDELTIRALPGTGRKNYGTLKNGDVVRVDALLQGEYWIHLGTSGLDNVPNDYGFSDEGLLLINPRWIVTTEENTYAYAEPWESSLVSAQYPIHTPLLVISESKEFYCVQRSFGQAGSAFVRKSDIGVFKPDPSKGPAYSVIVDGPLDVYDDEYKGVKWSLESLQLVQILSYNTDRDEPFRDEKGNILKIASIFFKLDNKYYHGWADCLHIQPVIN